MCNSSGTGFAECVCSDIRETADDASQAVDASAQSDATAQPDSFDDDTANAQDGSADVVLVDLCESFHIVGRDEAQTLLPNNSVVQWDSLISLKIEGDEDPRHGGFVSYLWNEKGPGQSAVSWDTAPDFETKLLFVNPGSYSVHATLLDRHGDSCRTHDYTIQVESAWTSLISPQGFTFVLLWHTPGDPMELDVGGDTIYSSAGSDMDLHLLHPKANGAYFDWSYDCYWDNSAPEWGIFSPSDNPRFLRDDTDGFGPEVSELQMPEAGAIYKVGVHYWKDWGFGPSLVTVRVYFDGTLVEEWKDVELWHDDLWDIYSVDGATHAVTRVEVDGRPRIFSNYSERQR